MGYRTYHKLEVIGSDTYSEIRAKGIELFGEHSAFAYAISPNESIFENETRWDYEEMEMRLLSTHFPNSILVIHGEGEDNYDLWRAYYKNGKMQHASAMIVFEDFDESKLS